MSQPDYEALSKGISQDMSPEAIAGRLKIVSELYDLARTLSTAEFLGRVEPPTPGPAGAGARDAGGTDAEKTPG